MKVRKILIGILAVSLMIVPFATVSAATGPAPGPGPGGPGFGPVLVPVKATASTQTVIVDGNATRTEAYSIDGKLYFKLRDIAMLLNGTPSQFSVAYDAKSSMVTAVTGQPYQAAGGELVIGQDRSGTCYLGTCSLKVNDLVINASKYNVGGNNFYNLSDLDVALGFAIESSSNDTINITSGKVSLVFNDANYTVKTLTVGDKTITYRAYENIVYVSNPVDTQYQVLNFFVPETYYKGESIGNYNAKTAPIFFPNSVGGYMPGPAGSPGLDMMGGGGPNAASVALSKGYVVAAPGARGRTTQDENGLFTGKAPACIVDLKAAVRYLRYNDEIMPGSAERIVSNGTSAGGALSSLLGATGNNADYEPYLREIGAAEQRDDIFAVSSYCPITNLDNSDTAYEWLFNGINGYTKMVFSPPTDGQFTPPSLVPSTMTADQIKVSEDLKVLFPAYLNGLGLKKADGTALTLDVNGDGTFKDYVRSFVIAAAQKALNSGTDMSDLSWLTIKDGTVTDIDFAKFVGYVARMKAAPAFDGLDLSTGENDLFGTATINAQHFTQFGKDNSTVDGSLEDAAIVKMLNPMNYIGSKGTTTAQYWRIRHGTVDPHTSLAIPVILATTLQNKGFDVDLAMPWGQGHGGDYDLDELFAWMDNICDPLKFQATDYTMKTLTVGDQTITYRAYENIGYVKYPVDTQYQVLNLFVPIDISIDEYDTNNVPIFFPNSVGGYMPGPAGSPGLDMMGGGLNAAFVALSKGYIVAAPGARGRTTQDENGLYTGKAPACIVDLKAAVRYLRYNDGIMPGNAERIISSGTSAGGALSSLLGATGNNKDYEPYLKAIGAADERDDIFAASCYCPITNLDNSDTAYEWQFNGINEYNGFTGKGTLNADQIKVSDRLKALFPGYLNGLGLKKADGTALTLDADGNGTFKDYVKSFIVESAQKALNSGKDLSGLPFITIKDGIVTDIDYDEYIGYFGRMKSPPAFDALDLSSGENDLFGSATIKAQHFTQFGKDNSTAGGSLEDPAIVKMLNPMNYIGTEGTTTARYWRVRHGAVDPHTSFAIPVILATELQNKGISVDYAMPWGQGHGGDYDLDELFAWIASLVK